jgi:hypothetical protein
LKNPIFFWRNYVFINDLNVLQKGQGKQGKNKKLPLGLFHGTGYGLVT